MRVGRGRHLALRLLLCGFLVAGAACGGSQGESPKVASVGQQGRSGNGDGTTKEGEQDPEKAMLAFARCMRENGVDMPDPEPGSNGVVRFEARPGQAGGGTGLDMQAFERADKACRHLMGDAGPRQLSPEDQKAMQDAMLAFARCMREHGVDMPDPEPGGGGIRAPAGEAPDPWSPEFRAAEKECRRHTEALDKQLGVERSEG